MKKRLTILLFIFAIVGFIRAAQFIYQEGHSLSFQKSFEVDSEHYSNQAKKMIASGSYFSTQDMQHSIGMQILVGGVYRIFGLDHNQPIKLLNLFAWMISIFCSAVLIWKMKRDLLWVAAIVFILCYSNPLKYYSAIVQYELILAALFSCFVLLCMLPKFEYFAGIALGFIIIFKITYIVLVPLAFLLPYFEKRWKVFLSCIVVVGGASVLTGFFSNTSHVIGLKFHTFQNMAAQGYAYPYGEIMEPSGWQFIFSHPVKYLHLLILRAAYFFGIWRDIWFLPLFIKSQFAERAIHYIFLFVSAFALFPSWRNPKEHVNLRFNLLYLAIFTATLAPLVFHGASFRFFIPLLPLSSVLFLLGIVRFFRFSGLIIEKYQ